MSKPLWQQFLEMTPEELASEQAADRARMKSGSMTEAEATAREAAWRQVADYRMRQAEALEKFLRFRKAQGGLKVSND